MKIVLFAAELPNVKPPQSLGRIFATHWITARPSSYGCPKGKTMGTLESILYYDWGEDRRLNAHKPRIYEPVEAERRYHPVLWNPDAMWKAQFGLFAKAYEATFPHRNVEERYFNQYIQDFRPIMSKGVDQFDRTHIFFHSYLEEQAAEMAYMTVVEGFRTTEKDGWSALLKVQRQNEPVT